MLNNNKDLKEFIEDEIYNRARNENFALVMSAFGNEKYNNALISKYLQGTLNLDDENEFIENCYYASNKFLLLCKEEKFFSSIKPIVSNSEQLKEILNFDPNNVDYFKEKYKREISPYFNLFRKISYSEAQKLGFDYISQKLKEIIKRFGNSYNNIPVDILVEEIRLDYVLRIIRRKEDYFEFFETINSIKKEGLRIASLSSMINNTDENVFKPNIKRFMRVIKANNYYDTLWGVINYLENNDLLEDNSYTRQKDIFYEELIKLIEIEKITNIDLKEFIKNKIILNNFF